LVAKVLDSKINEIPAVMHIDNTARIQTVTPKQNKKLYNDYVLSLNASDERGIKIVRDKIKIFANLSIVRRKQDTNIPPFKIIILDEADAMSNDSQFALRRIMEKYYHNTRFILICNYVTKIIPPLASRCSKFRFLPIDYESSKSMINNMLKLEGYNVNISEEIFKYVYRYTVGDLRKTITLFQRLSYIVKFENLTIDIIRESIGEISDDLLTEIITLIENKNAGIIYLAFVLFTIFAIRTVITYIRNGYELTNI
jgi:replication factor C subunit 2/4